MLESFLAWTPWSIIIISLVLAFVSTLIYKYFTNQEEIKRLRERSVEIRKKMTEHKDKPQEVMGLQKESLGISLSLMKQSMKPSLIMMVPYLLIFAWLNNAFPPGTVVFKVPLFGWELGFFWTYFIFIMIFSIALRKVLKIH